MNVSVVDPIDQAVKWTKRILFDEFSLGKWFVLGFCAFLATLGEGGAANAPTQAFRWHERGKTADFSGMDNWVRMHMGAIVLIGAGILLFALVLGLLFTWLNSRGKFMFLDGVVRDREAVSEPWHRYRARGNSLFFFRIVLGIVSFLVLGGLAVGIILLIVPAARMHHVGVLALIAVVLGAALVVVLAFALALVMAVLKDFVVPIMYRRDLTTVPAFRVFLSEILPGNVLAFILFYLLKIVLGIAAAILIFVGTCLTCCIAAIPYISSVVFLPVFVFFRCYSVYFLEQFGPEWRFFESGRMEDSAPADAVPEAPIAPPEPQPEG